MEGDKHRVCSDGMRKPGDSLRQLMQNNSRLSLFMFVYLFISGLFILKYLSRINGVAVLVALVVFAVFVYLLWRYRTRLVRFAIPVLICYTLVFAIAVPVWFPPGTFDVDRWDMISVFSDTLLRGDYPFAAVGMTTENTPAQSPFYFVLTSPFYLTSFYVGIPLAGIWIYWLVEKYLVRMPAYTTLLIVAAPFTLYETLTCSSIFFNATIVCAWALFAVYGKRTLRFMIIHGIAGGLLLCTRNCFIIPVIMLGMALLRCDKNVKQTMIWGLTICVVFFLCYLPFVFGWGYDQWLMHNPFKVQSELILSVPLMVAIVVGAAITSFFCKNLSDSVFFSGIWLFVACVCVLVRNILNYEGQATIFDPQIDLTYFILCIPFLGLSYHRNKKTEVTLC